MELGNRMIIPGIYEFDPSVPVSRDDLEKYKRLLRYSRIPPQFDRTHRISTFEIVKGRRAGYDAALEFLREDLTPPFLMLVGEPGPGKTHLVVGIAFSFIAQLRSALFYHVGELLDDLRAGIATEKQMAPGDVNSWTSTSILSRCKNSALLVLDDLGVENKTDWAWERLDIIVNYRYEQNLPTVITTNTLEVSDRIRNRCIQGRVVALAGESYRSIIARRRAAARVKAVRVQQGQSGDKNA